MPDTRTLRTEAYMAAKDRVKVSYFTEQGYTIRGLVHVGANDGYEVQYYLDMGIEHVYCFEPLAAARELLAGRYGSAAGVVISSYALGNIDCSTHLHVTTGDGKGSSVLPLPKTDKQVGAESIEMRRFSTLIRDGELNLDLYNCIVIDVQGMELDVLRGMDRHLACFDFLSVECSNIPLYPGEASAKEVVTFLAERGFQQVTPIPAHDDVMFINQNVLHPPEPPRPIPVGNKLNIGSGQRRFDNAAGWVNVDCASRPPDQVPDLICDVGKEPLPYADDSVDYVVLHQVYEHFGLGEGHGLVREAHRVLRPGGSLILTMPDMRVLAQRWLTGQLSDYIYFVNVYGAYQGLDGDRHKWGYTYESLKADFQNIPVVWSDMRPFNWRPIPGADIARDFWILGMECVK